MSIAEKLTTVAENMPKVYEAGQDAERTTFWNKTQKEGNREDYEYAFTGVGWTNDNYKPEHTIRGAITNAFRKSRFTNTLVPIVVVGGTANAFNVSYVTTIPSIDLTEATNTSTCFNQASRLVDVTFIGTIPTTINMQFASGLSVASMKSAILHLANYTGTENANVNSLFFSDDCWAALEADSNAPDGGTWKKYVDSLGWNT